MKAWTIGAAALLLAAAGGGAAVGQTGLADAPAKVTPSGITAELADFAAPPPSDPKPPMALLNDLYFAPDGSGRLYAADGRGTIWRIAKDGTVDPTPFLSISGVRGPALNTKSAQAGLRGFAFHPDFAKPGRPGFGRLYTLSVENNDYDPPSDVRVFRGAFTTIAQSVLAEWKVEPGPDGRVDPSSRRELLRINHYRNDHNADRLLFNPVAKPGSADYGKLYIGVGDGGDTPGHPDQFDSAQDPSRALGKILRIDPLGGGHKAYAYGVPKDNPLLTRRGALAELWALGLRHPQGISFDLANGAMIIADTGQSNVEELDLGKPGANYGWPLREGRHVTERFNDKILHPLPDDDAKNGFTYPVAEFGHADGEAEIGGYVYRGTAVPALVGKYIYGDMVEGRVFVVDAAAIESGGPAKVEELALTFHGRPLDLKLFVGRANHRVDLRFGQGEDGEVYLMTKQDGRIYRFKPSAAAAK